VSHPRPRTAPARILAGVNVALLAAVAVAALVQHVPEDVHAASPAGLARPRGEYTMVSGRAQGMSTAAIFLFDSANQELLAVTWDRAGGDLKAVGFRSVTDDAQIGGRPR
jgi:hypothetical protein